MRVRITAVQKQDPRYFIRWRIIGLEGEAEQIAGDYWYSLTLKTQYKTYRFMYCKFERIA